MFWTAIAAMVIGGYYFDLQKQKLKLEKRGGANTKDVRRQLGQLMAENEEIKERLRNLEYLISDKKDFIDLSDYEKEQRRLDNNNNRFEY